MKKLVTTMAAAATVALTALIAAAPANAAPRQNDQVRHSGPGYYEGLYEYHVDRDDRASSPYQSGGY